jgi:hypothetical protein
MKSDLDLLIEQIKRGEWSGEAMSQEMPPATGPAPVCWHCGGSSQCDCISCGVMKPSVSWDAGPCVPCQHRARKDRLQ